MGRQIYEHPTQSVAQWSELSGSQLFYILLLLLYKILFVSLFIDLRILFFEDALLVVIIIRLSDAILVLHFLDRLCLRVIENKYILFVMDWSLVFSITVIMDVNV